MNLEKLCKDNGFEIVEDNMFRAIIRIQSGLLLYINKYKKDYSIWYGAFWNMKRDYPKKYKKVNGISKCFVFIDDAYTKYINPDNQLIPKGTYIFEGYPIIPIENPLDYTYEFSISGGRYVGDATKFLKLINDLSTIIGAII